jgi:hypothetical protein
VTWTAEGTLVDATTLGALAPADVLYEFDGPRVFTSVAPDGSQLLAYVCDENASGFWLLVVPTADEVIADLRAGRTALLAALDQPWVWLVERDFDGNSVSVRRITLALVPAVNLPQRGVRLTGEEALVRIRLSGKGIGRTNVPASVARRGVDAVTTGLKSLFDHVVGRESFGRPRDEFRRLYDLPVQELAFNSFEVAFGEPVEPAQGHLGIEDAAKSNAAAQKTAAGASDLLRRAIGWLEGPASKELPDDDEATSLAMLRALEKMTPPQTGLVEKVEISGSLLDRTARKPVILTRVASKRVRVAIARVTAEKEELVTLSGVISEFDKQKLSFILREIAEQLDDQKCVIDETLYDDAYDRFIDDARVVVVGRRTRGKSDPLAVIAIQPQPPANPAPTDEGSGQPS